MERGESETMNLGWEEALRKFQNVMASGTKPLKLNAIAQLARFSEHVPKHVLSRVIPILTEILAQSIPNDPSPSLQEVDAYCLMCISYRGDGAALVIAMGTQGVTHSLIKLLPHSKGEMQEVLIKLLLVLVTFSNESRKTIFPGSGFRVIMNLLNSHNNDNIRLYLLEILRIFGLQKDVRNELIRLGALHLIVEAAGTGIMVSRERTSQSIELFGGVPSENEHELVELGAVPMLVDLLRDGDQTTKLTAAKYLRRLSVHVDGNTRPFTQAGAIPLFVELLQGPDPYGKGIAEDVLSELAVREHSAVEIVGHLVRILREGDHESKVYATNVKWDLSIYPISSSVIRDSGAIPVLVVLLRSGTEKVMENVSRVFAELSYDAENRVALAKAGAIPILMVLLHQRNEEVRDNAAEAVFNFYEDALHHHRVSHAINVPSFKYIRDRLIRDRASNGQITRASRRMSVEQLIGNLQDFL
ncbi:U-box domain-containing protein 11-like [Lotus japonicus]|uniref:U-box domain-containing protein 11-like n=1 Tax=Lotus japonicus TaxID=34305 RepID=UPI002586D2AA|nr:U-box domain-containing protein 11-like [Lotus japonicus]